MSSRTFVVLAVGCLGALLCVAGCQKHAAPGGIAAAPLPSDDVLRDRIDRALEFTYANRHLSTKDQAAWQIVHGSLCFGRDFQIYADGQLVPAIDYLLADGKCPGWVLRKGDHGLEAQTDPGSKTGQGHEDQWLGYLSQVGLPVDQPIVVGGQPYTIRDLITQAQWDIYDGMEATWTLMAFAKYLPLDSQWTAKDGTTWSIPRMVNMEADQDLNDSACGGSHRMYALTMARNRYLAEGGDYSGPDGPAWAKANEKIADAVETIREFQQPDGSLSAQYFVRPATSADLANRLGTTGHQLEFLMVALDDQELQHAWVTRAVNHLVGCFEKTQRVDLECGALYHAARGLQLYRARKFGPWSPAGGGTSPAQPSEAGAAGQ